MPPPPDKPRLRGSSHHFAFYFALAAGLALIWAAPSPRARLAALIYSASLTGVLGTSALFHRRTWSPRIFGLLQRVDHAAIFGLIAGTYTPFCLLLPPEAGGVSQLIIMWSFATVGALKCTLWPTAPRRLNVALYMIMGWLPVITSSAVLHAVSWTELSWLAAGGALYTIGGLIFALRRPDPIPHIFGYHEVFHLLVVLAAACHFAAVQVVVNQPGIG
jgi:hemolysin III